MSTIEERMFQKLKERIVDFEKNNIKVFLPLKQKRIIYLYKRFKAEFDGEARVGCKWDSSSIQIRIVCKEILDVEEAGTFLELIRRCDFVNISSQNNKVIIDLRYQLWKWVEK